MLAYDPKSAILLLVDEDSAVFVNTSLCLDPVESHAWLRENNSVVSALGYLEELPVRPESNFSDLQMLHT